MITLEEYKKHLIDYYRYEIDNNDQKKKKRLINLSRQYSDEELQSIITSTYHFIRGIFQMETVNDGYCSIPIEEDRTEYIRLNIVGGGNSDTILVDDNGNKISRYIIKKEFGEDFYIEIKEEEVDSVTNDRDILSFDYHTYIYMQGFPKNMKKQKERLFGREKVKMK